MLIKCPHSSYPLNLQDRTLAWLLTSPLHGGVESRGHIQELRIRMSPQMPHGPLYKHAAPRLRAVFCRVQSTITWLLTHSHDTSPSSAAAVFGRHCSNIHTIPAPQQRSAVCRGHPLIHITPAPHQRLQCRGYPLIHTIPAPHKRLPCVEDSFKAIRDPRGARSHLMPLRRKAREGEGVTDHRHNVYVTDAPVRKSMQRRGVT